MAQWTENQEVFADPEMGNQIAAHLLCRFEHEVQVKRPAVKHPAVWRRYERTLFDREFLLQDNGVTRYEKTDTCFAAMIYAVNILITPF